eukprot:3103561-Amphidinium_carterae.1
MCGTNDAKLLTIAQGCNVPSGGEMISDDSVWRVPFSQRHCFTVLLEHPFPKCLVLQCLENTNLSNAIFNSVWRAPFSQIPCFVVFWEDQSPKN